jgi:hypothetical protein
MADQADHCSNCKQRVSDWLDEDGKEMKDPPFEVVEMLCPGCQELGLHREDHKNEKETRHGVYYGFRRRRD